MRAGLLIAALLLLTFGAQAWFSQRFEVDLDNEPDGKYYVALAGNLLAHGVFSPDDTPDPAPTYKRLPGYPWFLAGVIALCGEDNMPAVRLFQAGLATLVCAGVGWLAFLWTPDPARRVRAACIAFALAALCPFTAIYTAVVEPEMLTMFFTVALLLAATWAFRARTRKQATLRWVTAGLLAGAMQMVRPESGLFAASVGLTLVGVVLFAGDGERPAGRLRAAVRDGAVFSCAFALVLVPWTWRNFRVFHRFSPLPSNAAHLPAERDFHGFNVWYRTWADSEWSLEPYYWGMTDGEPATTAGLPDRAFDSAEERARTEALFARYNTPSATNDAETKTSDEPSDDAQVKVLGLTPELEAEFGRLGQERADRAPWRQYLILPLRRAWNLWFSPHATYYDFDGPPFPSGNGSDRRGHFWPAVFFALLCVYTVLALAGLWRLARSPLPARADARRWVSLAVLIVALRWAYLATMENTEPRYMVEIFPLVCVLGGIALARTRATTAAGTALFVPGAPTTLAASANALHRPG